MLSFQKDHPKRRKLGEFCEEERFGVTNDKVEEIEDSDDEVIKDIESAFDPINKDDPNYFVRKFPPEKKREFLDEFNRIKGNYGDSIQSYKAKIKSHETVITEIKRQIIRTESRMQRDLDALKEEYRVKVSPMPNSTLKSQPIRFSPELQMNVEAKIHHIDRNGNKFFVINRNQESFQGRGSNACSCISVICCSHFLTGRKKPEEMDWWFILRNGVSIYSEAKNVIQYNPGLSPNFQSGVEVFEKVGSLAENRKHVVIAGEFGGYLNGEGFKAQQNNGDKSEEKAFVSFTTAIRRIETKYDNKVALSVTIGIYTITILVTEHEDEWYLYDSHDYLETEKTSLLIKFTKKEELCKYVLDKYTKVEFKNGTQLTGYSMVVFIKKEDKDVIEPEEDE
jgi:hypothetical protein